MNVIIVGCGRVGSALAYQLYEKHFQVTVVDHRSYAFEKLHPEFQGRVVEGDCLTENTLRRAGIENAEALAAVTDSDSINIVIAHVARDIYRVPKVVLRNYDPDWQPVYAAFGLPIVGSASLEVQRMDELLSGVESRQDG